MAWKAKGAWRYGVSVVAVALAVATLFIPVVGRGFATALFFAVLVSAWVGGLGPGLLATALIVAANVTVRIAFGGSFQPQQVVALILFTVGGVVVSWLVEALHAARRGVEASRARLVSVLTSIGDAVIATDERGLVSFLNPVAEQLTGWHEDEAAGRPLHEVFAIVNEETRATVENPVEKVLRSGAVVGLANHTVLIARDGSETPIDDSAAPIRDASGRLGGVVLIFRDITERRRAEEARNRLAAIVESSDDAIIAKSLDGTILSWNAGAERIFGYPAAEVVGRSIHVLVPPDRADDLPRIIERIRDGERVENYETKRRRKDGEVIDVSLTISPIRNASGAIVGASKIARDITRRKRAEEQLREAKEAAESANRAKDQFLAVLSHELRTPLNPIMLAVTAMLERPVPPDEVRPNLEMIRENVALEARLIDDLLDVMRIDRGKMPLRWGIADAHALIRHAVEVCRGDVEGKGLALGLDLAAAEHHAHADAARLEQVIWNLLKNAVKFTPGGGSVAVRTRNEPDPRGDGNLLVIELADTGIGIEPELMSRIFDPFQQGETSITRRYGGLGLGLAISRGVVEAHGGLLTAESAGPGLGSTFRVELQALCEPEAPAGAPPAVASCPSANGGPETLRILLVEDEPTTLRMMSRLLATLGHEVTTAATLADAVAAAGGADFDLVISDIGLPDGSGLDLMRQVSARGAVAGIALTGYGMEEDLRRSREAGFAAHLTKPIDFTRLEAVIRQVAPSRPAPEPAPRREP